MISGKLDRRITIQAKTVTPNGYGEPVETWADEATIWAEYLPLRGMERFSAQQVIGEVDTKFRIRYRANVSEARNRIVYDGKIYDIQPPIEIGRREGLEIYAKGRTA